MLEAALGPPWPVAAAWADAGAGEFWLGLRRMLPTAEVVNVAARVGAAGGCDENWSSSSIPYRAAMALGGNGIFIPERIKAHKIEHRTH